MLKLIQQGAFLKSSERLFCTRKAQKLFPQTRKPLGLYERQRLAIFSTLSSGNPKVSPSGIKWFWMPAGVGFALISFLQLRHIQQREKRKNGDISPERLIAPWQVTLFKVVPTRVLSRLWGKVHDVELPVFLRGPVIRLWVWIFDCKLEEAVEEDVTKYANLGAFFTRKLKPGVRRFDEQNELVCPVDGKVIHFGHLVDGMLEQVKGVPYSLETFVGPNSPFHHPNDVKVRKGKYIYYCVLYLGPGDCHHFHSPTEWKVNARRHFSGELYSVSPWVLRGFKDVLCTNERVTLFGSWKHGLFTMSAVGAYNVGSIRMHFDHELDTNEKRKTTFKEKPFSLKLSRGEPVGLFSMGSAIVLIFEAPKEFQFCIKPNQKVILGQPLGTVVK